MHIGKWLLVKNEDKVEKGVVIKIYAESIDVRLEDNTILNRKFWEVRSIPPNEKEEN